MHCRLSCVPSLATKPRPLAVALLTAAAATRRHRSCGRQVREWAAQLTRSWLGAVEQEGCLSRHALDASCLIVRWALLRRFFFRFFQCLLLPPPFLYLFSFGLAWSVCFLFAFFVVERAAAVQYHLRKNREREGKNGSKR